MILYFTADSNYAETSTVIVVFASGIITWCIMLTELACTTRPYWFKGNWQTQAMFLYFENCCSGEQILWWGELCKYCHMHKAGHSILLVQIVQAHVAGKAAANLLQIEKDTKAGISWVRMNLFGSSPGTCTCCYLPENRIAIFVSVYTTVLSTQILDIVFLHEAAIKMQSDCF